MAKEINICFVDYVYPHSCDEHRWSIIDILQTVFKKYTGMDPGFRCIPSTLAYEHKVDLNSSVVDGCVAFTGVERTTHSQLANKDAVIVGPVYNYSRDFVIPVTTRDSSGVLYPGWGFIYALDWTVWATLVGVVMVAIGVQMLMKCKSIDASPTLDRETGAEVVSRSILSTVGYSRLYPGDSHIFSRHILSCCMAFFSVGIVSLYCSNLINFFYTGGDSHNFIPPTHAVGVHPSLKNIVSLETFGLFSGNRQTLRVISIMPNATFYDNIIPVVTRTVGESFKNATTTLRSLGGYQTIYEVYIARKFINQIEQFSPFTLKDIEIDINREILAWKRSRTTLSHYIEEEALHSRRGNSPLTINDIYGVFILLVFGYIASILFRIFFTKKIGLKKVMLCKNCFRRNDAMTTSPVTESFGLDDKTGDQMTPSPDLDLKLHPVVSPSPFENASDIGRNTTDDTESNVSGFVEIDIASSVSCEILLETVRSGSTTFTNDIIKTPSVVNFAEPESIASK